MNSWQPIKTAPKDGTRILVVGSESNQVRVDLWKQKLWWLSRQSDQPTHWMPLPAPPTE